jgi:hypothetical protein
MLQYLINDDCVLVENESDKEDKHVRAYVYKMHVKSMLMMMIKVNDYEEEKGAEN